MTIYKNTIYKGDSATVLKDFPPNSIDLVVTDPPYLVNYKDRFGRSVANDANADGVLPVFNDIYRVMKSNSYCVSFCGWTALDKFTTAWTNAGFRIVGNIVWVKNYASKSGYALYKHESAFILAKGNPAQPANPIADVQPWEYTGNKCHPTQKAVSVNAPLIKCFSKAGDVVLDPFAGSGTTAVAAATLGPDYIGIELEEQHCKTAESRLMHLNHRDQFKASA